MTTTTYDLRHVLRGMRACAEAVEWVGERDLETAWDECERGDWMLWLAGRAGVEHKALVLTACACAERALVHVPEGEDRPRQAIETTRAWCEGEATRGQVRAAVDAAIYAAHAAHAAHAASAAAHAAHAAHAAYAAYAASAAERKAQAKVVREYIKVTDLKLP